MLEDDNSAASDMLVLRHDIPAAPIMMLPNELISHIFSFAATPDTKWITVTHVCKHWRNIALGNTTLWNNINLFNLNKSWAIEFLRRSSPGPFSMTVTRYMPEAVRDSLEAGDISRLQGLIVDDRSIFPSQDDDETTLAKLLYHRKSAAPMLKSLRVWRTFPHDDRLKFPLSLLFPSEIQNLRSISLGRCALDWDPTYLANLVHLRVIDPDVTTPLQSLTGVSVTPTEQQLSRMLRGLPRLEMLRLSVLASFHGNTSNEDTHRDPIVLPSLTSLRLSPVAPQWSEFITTIDAPSLTTSRIDFIALPHTVSSTLTHLGGRARQPEGLVTVGIVYDPTAGARETEGVEKHWRGLKVSLAHDANTKPGAHLDIPLSVDAIDGVRAQLLRGLDLSKLRVLWLSLREDEIWAPARWRETFGHARQIESIVNAGPTAARSLSLALAAHHPDEFFPLLDIVLVRDVFGEVDEVLELLSVAIRTRGERALQNSHEHGRSRPMETWVVTKDPIRTTSSRDHSISAVRSVQSSLVQI
ncbi:hypothetical protein BV25DRAFT_768039 [Artomyces pyxidatus]|uniref:Uncharacterized protein n=1 Tax=Artomyces pyxidatus TaxID=48021 RepID=A0ACB8SZD9_9AGAM|nr:hypothetical protein BV25DRAFT_768039 [Artomyces pyxidatus]